MSFKGLGQPRHSGVVYFLCGPRNRKEGVSSPIWIVTYCKRERCSIITFGGLRLNQ